MSVNLEDIDRIMAVMTAAFDPQYGEAWTRRQVEDAMILGNCHYGLIGARGLDSVPGDNAVGFWLSRHGFEEEELLLLAVDPGFRRMGLGRLLLTDLARSATARGARRLLLEMRRDNPAEALYCAFGFQPIGRRPNYYRTASGDRIDALTFARALE